MTAMNVLNKGRLGSALLEMELDSALLEGADSVILEVELDSVLLPDSDEESSDDELDVICSIKPKACEEELDIVLEEVSLARLQDN